MKQRRLSLVKIAAVAMLCAGAAFWWWKAGERKRIRDAAVAAAHLAAIPDSEYRVATSGNMFARSFWIVFTCNENAFEKFVTSSPGLRGVIPYFYPCSETDPVPTTHDQPPESTREQMRGYDAFWESGTLHPSEAADFWDASKKRERGRHYEIIKPQEDVHGFLLRDDDTGEVFLKVSNG